MSESKAKTTTKKATETAKKAATQAAESAKKAAVQAAETGKKAAETVKLAAGQAAVKAKRAVEEMKPEILVQFAGEEVDVLRLAEQAKAAFRQEKKRTAIRSFRLYVKPEDRAAYYVINDEFDGKIDF